MPITYDWWSGNRLAMPVANIEYIHAILPRRCFIDAPSRVIPLFITIWLPRWIWVTYRATPKARPNALNIVDFSGKCSAMSLISSLADLSAEYSKQQFVPMKRRCQPPIYHISVVEGGSSQISCDVNAGGISPRIIYWILARTRCCFA